MLDELDVTTRWPNLEFYGPQWIEYLTMPKRKRYSAVKRAYVSRKKSTSPSADVTIGDRSKMLRRRAA